MDPREIKKIRRSISNGNRQFILSNIEIGRERVNADLLRLRESKEEMARQYFQQRSIWTHEAVLEGTRPAALADQVRIAALALIGALTINLIEALVAGWVSAWGVVPILLAVLLPISIKTVLVTLWHNENQPQETVRKIKLFVLAPTLVMFSLAAIFLLMVRVVPDDIAMKLDLIFSVSILTLGIGCLSSAAGLFALAHIYYWSKSAEFAYRKLEIEAINTEELLKVIETTEIAVRTSLQSTERPALPRTQFQTIAQTAGLAIFALLPSLNMACASGNSSTTDQTRSHFEVAAAAEDESTGSDLRIFFDTTNSQSRESYEVVVDSVIKQLPQIVEKNRAGRLVVYVFANRGWEAHSIFDVALPEVKKPRAPTSERDELEILRGRKNKVVEAQAQQKYRQLIDQSIDQYRNELNAVLSRFPGTTLITAVDHQAHCTDLNGALARIANIDATHRNQLVLLITDGVETCARTLDNVAEPNGEMKLAIILTSEKSGNGTHLLFSERRMQLHRSVPWASIGAYHDEDFNLLFGETSRRKELESLPVKLDLKSHIQTANN